MLTGRVTRRLQAVLSIRVSGPAGESRSVQGIVDTGFNGFLTLPAGVIESLGLKYRTTGTARVADGRLVALRKFEAQVDWLAAPREVYVLESDTTPLIGMSLLSGSELIVRVQADGDVRIGPIV